MTSAGTPEVRSFRGVRSVLGDPMSFTLEGDALQCGQRRPLIPLQSSPVDHPVHRALVGSALNHGPDSSPEPSIRRRAHELMDGFDPDGPLDINAAYSRLLPVVVLLDLLGLPASDARLVRSFHDGILHDDDPRTAVTRDVVATQVYSYLEPVVAARRGTSGDDLIRRLQHARHDGHALSDEQVVDVCFLLFLAGVDPVGNAVAGGIALLAARPDLRRHLDEEPSSWRRTIEELLRWGSSVTAIARVATTGAEIDGVAVSSGERIACVLAAANRDGAVFRSPDEFDPTRSAAHLAFGAGPHRCVGAHLARIQIKVGLQELHRRHPDLRLAPESAGVDPASVGAADRVMVLLR